MNGYNRITPEAVSGNAFNMIGNEWMLVTATGADGRVNTMTASWGGVGVLWNKRVAFVFIRPQRYTFGFAESGERATLSFFRGGYKKELGYCGSRSGRDTDKIADTGLTPVLTDEGATGFSEAELIMSCRKLYGQWLDGGAFFDEDARASSYPAEDYHKMFVYEIEGVYERK